MQQWIMIVDDNEINRLYFQRTLEKLGHQVKTVSSGNEAVTLCKESCDDQSIASLILMDIRMQKMNGIEATKRIRMLSAYKQIPILAISAEKPESMCQNLFQETLLKPIDKKTLADCISRYIIPLKRHDRSAVIDTAQGLMATNNDEDILQRIQHMLAQSLPKELSQIQQHNLSNDTIALNNHLHTLLGPVKLCGAVEIELAITQLKCVLDIKSERTKHIDYLKKAFDRFVQTVKSPE